MATPSADSLRSPGGAEKLRQGYPVTVETAVIDELMNASRR
ncbi:hypothetical protein [Natronomonas aquatica]|nr:hypothetical protein [Natronomonas aquatica]